MINFTCKCGKNYSVDEQYAGKKVRCKKCNNYLIVPSLKENETGVGIIIENSSKAGMSQTVRPSQKSISNNQKLTEVDLVKRLILTTVGIVVFLLICFISFILYRNHLEKKQQQTIAETINASVENGNRFISKFDYTGALRIIDDAIAQINNYKYVTFDNKRILNDEKSEIVQNKAAFDKKLASGYIVFEGNLILETDKNKILAERERVKQEEERERQRQIAEARKKEELAEKQKQDRLKAEALAQEKQKIEHERFRLFKEEPAKSFENVCKSFVTCINDSAPMNIYRPECGGSVKVNCKISTYRFDLEQTTSLVSPYMGVLSFNDDNELPWIWKFSLFFAQEDGKWGLRGGDYIQHRDIAGVEPIHIEGKLLNYHLIYFSTIFLKVQNP